MPKYIDMEGLRAQIRRTIQRVAPGLAAEDKKDIEQEALLEIYIHLQKVGADLSCATRIDDHAPLATTVAKRRAIDAIRRSNNPIRSAQTGLLGPQDDNGAVPLDERISEGVGAPLSPQERALASDLTAYLRRRINPNEQVLLGLVLQGYADSEIAQLFDISVKISKSRIQDLKKKCRKIMAEYDETYVVLQSRRQTMHRVEVGGAA